MIEDGLHPDDPLAGFTATSKVADVRRKADLSQDAFARALHVPVKTIRNWEQGRSKPDPAARALLAIVDDDPARAFRVIERRMGVMAADAKHPPQHPGSRTGGKGRASRDASVAADASARDAVEALDGASEKP